MDRLDWYRHTLIQIADAIGERCDRRSAARRHLQTLAADLAAGDHLNAETRQRLRHWSRRYQSRDGEDQLGRLVRSVLAAAALLESLEKQQSSAISPVLCNVARLASVAGARDPFVDRLATGRYSYAEVCEQLGAPV